MRLIVADSAPAASGEDDGAFVERMGRGEPYHSSGGVDMSDNDHARLVAVARRDIDAEDTIWPPDYILDLENEIAEFELDAVEKRIPEVKSVAVRKYGTRLKDAEAALDEARAEIARLSAASVVRDTCTMSETAETRLAAARADALKEAVSKVQSFAVVYRCGKYPDQQRARELESIAEAISALADKPRPEEEPARTGHDRAIKVVEKKLTGLRNVHRQARECGHDFARGTAAGRLSMAEEVISALRADKGGRG